ncbi:tRNA-binding protein [Candidatus Neomarinimicrobiota bacterium]
MTHIEPISFEHFKNLDLRTGTILDIDDISNADVSVFRLTIDFGSLGHRQSCAQITDHYRPGDLIGRQVVAVVNLPPHRVAGLVSEVLVLGGREDDGSVRLLMPDKTVANGTRLR